MPRNKHPEETVKIILDAALKLFLEKGYEKTTVLDIVGEMGGLTRGAFYHHFKSKEEVVVALTEKLFYDIDPFEKVKKRDDLNGLEKIKHVIKLFNQSKDYFAIQIEIMQLVKSPSFLKIVVDDQRDFSAPLFAELIEEGINDGSLKARYPKWTAELLMLLSNFWMIPTLYPVENEEEAWQKSEMLKGILEYLGVPVLDEESS